MDLPNPRNLFQQKLSSVIAKERPRAPMMENVFRLQQVMLSEKMGAVRDGKKNWHILLELYLELGATAFAKMISIIDGQTLDFPTQEVYQDSLVTTLCYYYKEVDGLPWEAIKERMGMPKLNTIKYGIRVQQLKNFIDTSTVNRMKDA